MSYTSIISTVELADHLTDPTWAVIDCRFALNNPTLGHQKYLEAHIPGAVYANLDEDLSGPPIPGETGRHPLPPVEKFAQTVANWGIDAYTQVIVYDDSSGMYAGRLWWMLRWMGHDAVAVLDGDFRHWLKEGRPVMSGEEQRTRRSFIPRPRPAMEVSVEEMVANLESGQAKVFDVRSEIRYRGEEETMYPVAGHIPGAHSAYYAHNLDAEGKFLPPEQLHERYAKLLGETPASACIFYCGSGVSVHHDLIALERAGLGVGARA
ncbi:sulfurtransferase [soil metagenome]